MPDNHECSKCGQSLTIHHASFVEFDEQGEVAGEKQVPIATCSGCELHHIFVDNGDPKVLPMDLFWRAA